MELQAKAALVTGAAHRVGKAIALGLAEQGCNLVIHYHSSRQAAAETIEEVKSFGVQAVGAQADLAQHADIVKLFRIVDEALGGLDILVNSAAIMQRADILEASQQEWDSTLDLNLKGTFFCLQQAAIRMRLRGGGAIINISDLAGLQPWRRYPIHCISKAGVEMLTRVAALSLAPDIRVNAIAPGLVLKPQGMDEAHWHALGTQVPLRRAGETQDVVRAVIFLLENDYITGETLVVDGGNLLR
jgi:pteridine reductase